MAKPLYFRSLTILIALLLAFQSYANRISKEVYIDRYKKIAIDEMKRSGIPASIKLAQGMIETGNGNSTLAKTANNHFGIKCHSNWKGRKIYHDDDHRNECFRKYDSPEESYRDHTNFLMTGKRYAFLFSYKNTDYKSWAHGLKKAGYATNPNYPQLLIRTIEENQLYRFDTGDYTRQAKISGSKTASDNFVIDINRRQVFERNRIKYIIVEKGDNLASLTKELDLFSWQLKKYNDLPSGYEPVPGEQLYIQPKRWRAETGNNFHTADSADSMHKISQLYGVKLKKLYRKNRMEPGAEPFAGQKIWLRKKAPVNEMQ